MMLRVLLFAMVAIGSFAVSASGQKSVEGRNQNGSQTVNESGFDDIDIVHVIKEKRIRTVSGPGVQSTEIQRNNRRSRRKG